MNFIRSQKVRYVLAFVVGSIMGIAFFMSVITAHADEVVSQVSIAGNGVTMVKGARVVKIVGNEITATTQWGASRMTWRIMVSGTTRSSPQADSRAAIKGLKSGHMIGFAGVLDRRASVPTVYASSLRNESVIQRERVISGDVISTGTESLIIQTDAGTSSIRIGTGTISTMNGDTASLSDIVAGTRITAVGTLNILKGELRADRVTAVSPDSSLQSAAPVREGIFATLVTWLSARSGALSVR